MKNIKSSVISSTEPASTDVLWIKPSNTGNELKVFTKGKWNSVGNAEQSSEGNTGNNTGDSNKITYINFCIKTFPELDNVIDFPIVIDDGQLKYRSDLGAVPGFPGYAGSDNSLNELFDKVFTSLGLNPSNGSSNINKTAQLYNIVFIVPNYLGDHVSEWDCFVPVNQVSHTPQGTVLGHGSSTYYSDGLRGLQIALSSAHKLVVYQG